MYYLVFTIEYRNYRIILITRIQWTKTERKIVLSDETITFDEINNWEDINSLCFFFPVLNHWYELASIVAKWKSVVFFFNKAKHFSQVWRYILIYWYLNLTKILFDLRRSKNASPIIYQSIFDEADMLRQELLSQKWYELEKCHRIPIQFRWMRHTPKTEKIASQWNTHM